MTTTKNQGTPASSGAKKVSELKLRLAGPESEVDVVFLQGMVNRMMTSFHKYGPIAEAGSVDNVASAWQRMAKYHQTGNTEYLIDAANFLMMEFNRMGPDAFVPTDSDGSIGRVRLNGQVDYAPN